MREDVVRVFKTIDSVVYCSIANMVPPTSTPVNSAWTGNSVMLSKRSTSTNWYPLWTRIWICIRIMSFSFSRSFPRSQSEHTCIEQFGNAVTFADVITIYMFNCLLSFRLMTDGRRLPEWLCTHNATLFARRSQWSLHAFFTFPESKNRNSFKWNVFDAWWVMTDDRYAGPRTKDWLMCRNQCTDVDHENERWSKQNLKKIQSDTEWDERAELVPYSSPGFFSLVRWVCHLCWVQIIRNEFTLYVGDSAIASNGSLHLTSMSLLKLQSLGRNPQPCAGYSRKAGTPHKHQATSFPLSFFCRSNVINVSMPKNCQIMARTSRRRT